MRLPRYEVRSITGYPATATVSGEGKLATTFWVADTWRNWREVPLLVVHLSRNRPRNNRWGFYAWAQPTGSRLTHSRLCAERTAAYLNEANEEEMSAA